MTLEDKAHLTPVLSSLSLLCHLKLKHCQRAFAHSCLFRRTVPSVHMRQIDKQAGRYEAIFTLWGAAGCRIGWGLKCFSGHLIGLI